MDRSKAVPLWLPLLGLGLFIAEPVSGQSVIIYSPITFRPNPGGGVVVSWPAVPQAAGYTLARVKEGDPCCNWSLDLSPVNPSAVDGLTSQGIYQYTVTARFQRLPSLSVQATYYFGILDPPPAVRGIRGVTVVTACSPARQLGGYPPTTVSPTHIYVTRLYLAWAAVTGAIAYRLERSEDLATWTDLGCLPSSVTGFRDQTRTDVPRTATIWPGGSYTYKVTAYQANGAAGWNSTTAILKRIAQPMALSHVRTGNQVKLCWSHGYPEPDRYVVTSSYGTNLHVSGESRCTELLGVPDGTHTFQVGSAYLASPTILESPVNNRPAVTVHVVP